MGLKCSLVAWGHTLYIRQYVQLKLILGSRLSFALGSVCLIMQEWKTFLKFSLCSQKLASLEEALAKSATYDPFTVCGIIDQFSQDVPVKETSAFNRYIFLTVLL